jgi:hypothetical protein
LHNGTSHDFGEEIGAHAFGRTCTMYNLQIRQVGSAHSGVVTREEGEDATVALGFTTDTCGLAMTVRLGAKTALMQEMVSLHGDHYDGYK